MAIPKKRTSLSKKRIRKNLWKQKSYFSIAESYCLAKSRSFSSVNKYSKPNGFSAQQTNKLLGYGIILNLN